MGQSRLDRILSDEYLAGLPDWTTDEVRTARAECESEEEGISYARRVLQGRLDILRAELQHREGDGDGEAEEASDAFVEELSTILSSHQAPTAPAQARSMRLRLPESAERLEAEIHELAGSIEVKELDHDELMGRIERLDEHERHLSGLRRQLFDRVDALRDELARRYKDGTAAVSEILSDS